MMKKIPLWSLSLCVASIAGHAFGQAELDGNKQFPLLRTISGMPGGLFGVNFDGEPDFGGAMAISTPVGATLRGNRYAFGLSSTSANTHKLAFFNRPGYREHFGHGVGFFMGGATIPHVGYVTESDEILSYRLDHVINFQFSPILPIDNIGVAVGVQNAFDHGAAGFPDDGDTSRSYYGVVTYKYSPGSYISIGHGDQRFHGIFGNFSLQFAGSAKFLTEYDSYNFNSGVAFEVGRYAIPNTDRYAHFTMFLGLIREKYPCWSIVTSF